MGREGKWTLKSASGKQRIPKQAPTRVRKTDAGFRKAQKLFGNSEKSRRR
jgi:hypothetical protein